MFVPDDLQKLDSIAYYLADGIRYRTWLNRTWKVGDIFTYTDRNLKSAWGMVTRVDGDAVYARLAEHPDEDVYFHRLSPHVNKC